MFGVLGWLLPGLLLGPVCAVARGTPPALRGFHPAADGTYVLRGGGAPARFDAAGFWLALRGGEKGVVLRFRFLGARPRPPRGEARRGRCHLLHGRDPRRWRRDVPFYGRVRYAGLYPGVDAVFHATAAGLEYDLVVAPSGDLGRIRIAVAGAAGLRLDTAGNLLVETPLGLLRQRPPRTFLAETGRSVACRYRLLGPDRFGFRLAGPTGGTVVVDPVLEWSTYLGGSGTERALAVVPTAGEDLVVVGETTGADFPATPGVFQGRPAGGGEAFVARLRWDGRRLLFATFLGGRGNDRATAVQLAPKGEILVAGTTDADDFPVTRGAVQPRRAGGRDAFLVRLDAAGRTLRFGTYVGGGGQEVVRALVPGPGGDVFLGGGTFSRDFPVTPGAVGGKLQGAADGFLARLTGDGRKLVAATYLGGPGADLVLALAPDGTGVAVAGRAEAGFPVTPGVVQGTYRGNGDAFFARLDGKLTRLKVGTYLGGGALDEGTAVLPTPRGDWIVAGSTGSKNFPVTLGSLDPTFNGVTDGFVVALDGGAKTLRFGTFLGGSGADRVHAAALDAFGAVTLVGETRSADFPVTPGASQARLAGGTDGFAARLDPAGRQLFLATFLGGRGQDRILGLALDRYRGASLVGGTASADFPVDPTAYDWSYNGATDAFLARHAMLPRGVTRYGAASPAGAGPLTISVTRYPRAGTTDFAFTATGAPPGSTGVLLLGLGGNSQGIPFLGIRLHVDPFFPLMGLSAWSDARGRSTVRVAIPAGTREVSYYAQFVWFVPPGGGGLLRASNALHIVIR